MNLQTEKYTIQEKNWPQSGRVILAQFDEESIIVYQAYHATIGHFAIKHGYLGGDFKMSRMTWIKPNFLWMMYRSGWGTKENQEVTLALRLHRPAFDEILEKAVYSTYDPTMYSSQEKWKQEVGESDVRLQWDPDHDPSGKPLERRAIQLGLRGNTLHKLVNEWIVEIIDMTEFVSEQRQQLLQFGIERLETPLEDKYSISNPALVTKLGIK